MSVQNYAKKKYKGYKQQGKQGRHGVLCRINNTIGGYPLHKHNYVEIEYLVTGKLEHKINGHTTIMSTGDCWCLDSRDLHMFTVLEPVTICNICIDLKNAPDVIQKFIKTFSFPMIGHIHCELRPIINSLFENLTDAIENECAFCEERIVAYGLLILTHIFENCESACTKPASPNDAHIAKAIEFIMQNYEQQITLTDVANSIPVSPNHLSKIFSEVCGNTFLDYLTNTRLGKAKKLLANTELPITQIAFDCGFGSFSSFSRLFKKRNGCTPSAYRNRKKSVLLSEQP